MEEHKYRVKLRVMSQMLSRCSKQFKQDVKKYDIPQLKTGRDLLFYPKEVEEYLLELTKTKGFHLEKLKGKTGTNKPFGRSRHPSQITSRKSDEQNSEIYFKSLLGLR